MKNKFTFLFASILLILIISCNTNKELQNSIKYFDQDSNSISKDRYKKLIDYQTNIDYCENDGANRNCFIIDRIKEGQLSELELKIFQSDLAKSLNKKIDYSRPLRITYYLKPDAEFDCIARTRNLEYTLSLEDEFSEYNNLYVAHPNFKFNSEKNEILIDKNNIINTKYFTKLIKCSNYLLINKNGEFISCIADGCERLQFE